MGARERAKADEAAGDLGSARRRLMSLLDTRGYEPAVCHDIGVLSLGMKDPVEAGRWAFISDAAQEPRLESCIESFLASCNHDSTVVLSRLPRVFKSVAIEDAPLQVRSRLHSVGIERLAAPRVQRPRLAAKSRLIDGVVGVGCWGFALGLGAVFVVGLMTINKWLFG